MRLQLQHPAAAAAPEAHKQGQAGSPEERKERLPAITLSVVVVSWGMVCVVAVGWGRPCIKGMPPLSGGDGQLEGGRSLEAGSQPQASQVAAKGVVPVTLQAQADQGKQHQQE